MGAGELYITVVTCQRMNYVKWDVDIWTKLLLSASSTGTDCRVGCQFSHH